VVSPDSGDLPQSELGCNRSQARPCRELMVSAAQLISSRGPLSREAAGSLYAIRAMVLAIMEVVGARSGRRGRLALGAGSVVRLLDDADRFPVDGLRRQLFSVAVMTRISSRLRIPQSRRLCILMPHVAQIYVPQHRGGTRDAAAHFHTEHPKALEC
jgi:hypothetical protein